ncbi:phosphatidate phosphatase APP1 [Okibacterium sp. HSC-33S16]|uniref:App1 family protein n=1 Tax=Okibacterium sp. HSC-33S16 TaxID=2910965 RepID=UPI00209D9ED8|nr:phosphatase domain-containing protein [Okibacterium sp. HSC-33S16]MCP2030682.1 phosphatidate phosphatase APP1 [Okibacterium sp. HSC-33S16]
MKSPDKPGIPAPIAALRLHRAARIDDAFLEWRAQRGRRRGLQATVIPYTGYGSTTWVRVLARVLLTKPDLSRAATPAQRVRGWRSFTSIPVVGAEVTITVGAETHVVTADRGGVVDARLAVELAPGWQQITLQAEDSRPVVENVFIVAPTVRFGVISDIDDTVMVTALPRPLVAAWNTFVLDEHARTPVPGMAVFLERIVREHAGSPVIYLSTGAWNVAPTLSRFLTRHLYPSGALLLTDWGPTHDRFFRSGRAHKATNLRRLAEEFPEIKWLLVGDDGQHDEELYGEFSAEFPNNVAAVAIRQLSPGEAVLAGGRSKPEEHATRISWVYAPDGAGLLQQLDAIDLA